MTLFWILLLGFGCSLVQSQGVSIQADTLLIPSQSSTPLTYSNLIWESYLNVTLPTNQVFVPEPGIYMVTASFYVLPPSCTSAKLADNPSIVIYVNGTEQIQRTVAAVNGDQTRLGISTVIMSGGNETIAVNAYQESGENLYLIEATLTIVKIADF